MKRDEDEDDDAKEPQEEELAGWMYHVPILLRKYGSHLMLALSLVLLGFVGWQKYQQSQMAKVAQAWADLESAKMALASGTGQTGDNPTNALRSIANSTDQPAIKAWAYLDLGQYYLATINQGHVDVEDALRQAEAAFNKIINDLKDQTVFVLNARMGLARAAEDRYDWDGAAAIYTSLEADAAKAGFPLLEQLAQTRLKNLPELKEPIARDVAEAPAMGPAGAPSLAPASAPGSAAGTTSGPATSAPFGGPVWPPR